MKINSLQEILTAKIVDLDDENKPIGNDPIKILDLWVGDDYLNIHFSINVGGIRNHSLNLVMKNKNENDIELELRHNSNGDESKYSIKNYASFDLRSLQKEGQQKITLTVTAKDFDDTVKKYTVNYNYKNLNS